MKADKKQAKIVHANEHQEIIEKKERKKVKKSKQEPAELQSSIGRYMNMKKK